MFVTSPLLPRGTYIVSSRLLQAGGTPGHSVLGSGCTHPGTMSLQLQPQRTAPLKSVASSPPDNFVPGCEGRMVVRATWNARCTASKNLGSSVRRMGAESCLLRLLCSFSVFAQKKKILTWMGGEGVLGGMTWHRREMGRWNIWWMATVTEVIRVRPSALNLSSSLVFLCHCYSLLLFFLHRALACCASSRVSFSRLAARRKDRIKIQRPRAADFFGRWRWMNERSWTTGMPVD